MADYIPTKLTPAAFAGLLSQRGDGALVLYIMLGSLGAHRDVGWTGSVRRLAAAYRALGRSPDLRTLRESVSVLEGLGLLVRSEASSQLSTYRLAVGVIQHPPDGQGGCDQTPTPPSQGGCDQTPTGGCDQTPRVGVIKHPPSTIGEKREDRERVEVGVIQHPPLSEHPGIDAPRLRVRGGKVERCSAPADGLADEVRAAGLRLSNQRVENLVRRCDSAEVRRQLAWLPRRDCAWCTGKQGALERWFEKLCTERELEPAGGDGGVKPFISADSIDALKATIRDMRATKGAVAKALKAVGAPDLDHVTADQRRRLLEALTPMAQAAPPPPVTATPAALALLASLGAGPSERTSSLPTELQHLDGQALADAKRRAKGVAS